MNRATFLRNGGMPTIASEPWLQFARSMRRLLLLLLVLPALAGLAQAMVFVRAEVGNLEAVNAPGNLTLASAMGLLVPAGNGDAELELSCEILSLAETPTAESAPVLTLTIDDQVLLIKWPAEATGYVLETTLRLDNLAVWQAVSPVPAQTSYHVSLNGPSRFFRLRR